MAKKSTSSLMMDMGPTAEISNMASKLPGEHIAKKHNEEVPADLLDQIVDSSNYSRSKKTAITTNTEQEEKKIGAAGEAKFCLIQGKKLPLNTEITIDPSLITKDFKGNSRNSRLLRNIDELAQAIIPDGHNSEPVKARPLEDGSGLELIKGKRRTAAVRRAKELTTKEISLRIIIAELDDKSATREAAMENVGNDSLTPWELADQLQVLLDTGSVESVAKLAPYLPANKKSAARTTILGWLEPAKIDKDIRAFIDESKPVMNMAITRLHRRWLNLMSSASKPVVLEKMSSELLNGKHAVQEIIQFIDDFEGASKKRDIPAPKSITNADGKKVARIKHKANGGISVDFEKDVPQEAINEAIAMLESQLKQI